MTKMKLNASEIAMKTGVVAVGADKRSGTPAGRSERTIGEPISLEVTKAAWKSYRRSGSDFLTCKRMARHSWAVHKSLDMTLLDAVLDLM